MLSSEKTKIKPYDKRSEIPSLSAVSLASGAKWSNHFKLSRVVDGVCRLFGHPIYSYRYIALLPRPEGDNGFILLPTRSKISSSTLIRFISPPDSYRDGPQNRQEICA